MPDFTVNRYGTDTSGRPILMTAYMAQWWESVVADLGFRPTIVQGAWMSRVPGGGAADSAGYHDEAGCLDLRTWDLSADQLEQTIRTLRRHGAAAWRRDSQHGGMDPHLHFVLGSDRTLARGAAQQWAAYQAGHDGLASNGPDYEWRPNPLVLNPPEEDEVKPEDIEAIAKQILDEETVELRKADGSTKKITVRNALTRILNPDAS